MVDMNAQSFRHVDYFPIVLRSEGIGFFLFNEELRLEKSHCEVGKFNRFFSPGDGVVFDLIPVLAGMEEVVQSVIRNDEEFNLQRVNHSDEDNRHGYFDLRLLPVKGKLLVIFKDTSVYGMLEQAVVQKRNEMYLYNHQLKKTRDRLEELSKIDQLTGLFNRHAIDQFVMQKFEEARLREISLSAVFFDIDNFKQINDRYGHASGDLVLKFLADLLRTRIRSDDVAIRWGGDEFVIILFDLEHEGANRIAGFLLSVLEQDPVRLPNDEQVRVDVSIGICNVAPAKLGAITLQEVIHTADAAMYISKRNGGRRISSLEMESSVSRD